MRELYCQKQDLLDLISNCELTNAVLVEIGSYAGESAEIFAQSKKFSTIVCIDPWKTDMSAGYGNSYPRMDVVEKKFDATAAKYNCIFKHKGTIDTFIQSDIYNKLKDKIDIVYIDGLHTYEGCKHDIEMCQTYIKPKYAISGHDYTDTQFWTAGVMKAVDEKLGTPDKVFVNYSWIKYINQHKST